MGGCPDISEHFDLKTYVSVRVCVCLCVQGVFQQSQLTSNKLEKQSSTFCLPHCIRAQPQHACLPQQNEKSIHVSHRPHLLQDN